MTVSTAELRAHLSTWRRHLHRHPELSFHEHETSRYVRSQLQALDQQGVLTITAPTPTSVLAVLRTERPGSTLLIRADMDALPIEEENAVPYRSDRPGVMHACGHDGHTAMLLGAVELLLARRQELSGELRFLFQHAEELPPGGAVELVQAGVMRGVDYVLGAHLWAAGRTGLIGIAPGPATAAPDRFSVTVRGRGGHAAMPHQTVDPVLVAAHLVTALQSIASRNVDPLESVVVSVTQLQAGSAYNVIPDEVTLHGTVRTLSRTLREDVPTLLRRITDGVCAAFGATGEVEYGLGYPSVLNDAAFTTLVQEVAVQTFGAERVVGIAPSMAGEDFAYYQEQAAGCFFSVGSGNPDLGITYPHHHPRFDIDEDALPNGTLLFVNTALALSAQAEERKA